MRECAVEWADGAAVTLDLTGATERRKLWWPNIPESRWVEQQTLEGVRRTRISKLDAGHRAALILAR